MYDFLIFIMLQAQNDTMANDLASERSASNKLENAKSTLERQVEIICISSSMGYFGK